ncbi:hypothetical protein [Butyrivibrio sp. JL13D10]|uniref:hypothetical protein n=1 Tax=Butyrivibrio sp. JL13D10 TaxID=3236815 RepID=UPI0038B440D6
MNEKKFSIFMLCHLGIMAILAILDLINGVLTIASSMKGTGLTQVSSLNMAIAFTYLLTVIAIFFGISYIIQGYSKQSSDCYKLFILMVSVANCCTLVAFMIALKNLSAIPEIPDNKTFISLGTVMLIAKIVLLLLLWTGKDLGKIRTWCVWVIILVIDLGIGLLFITPATFWFYRVLFVVSRLAIDLTIALSIHGKYSDKEARGRIQ